MEHTNTPAIGHAVFFTLKNHDADSIRHLVDECKTLEAYQGATHFNVGERGDGFDRPVNDQDFDVALYFVFKDRAAHDEYQAWPTHKAFIDRNKDSWARVRIFDSHIG